MSKYVVPAGIGLALSLLIYYNKENRHICSGNEVIFQVGVESLLWFFLVCFLIHEFEEIIYLGKFLTTNIESIKAKVPTKFRSTVDGLNTHSGSQFAFAVFEEIIMLVAIIALCLSFNLYSLFVAVVIAYELHVVFHIIQSIIIRRYIPAVGSGIITSIYCVACVYILHTQGMITWANVGIMTPCVVILMMANLRFAYYLAAKMVK